MKSMRTFGRVPVQVRTVILLLLVMVGTVAAVMTFANAATYSATVSLYAGSSSQVVTPPAPLGPETTTAARFAGPVGGAVDAAGNVYIAEHDAFDVRKITPAGVVTRYAGKGVNGHSDGTSQTAEFRQPVDVCIDAAGNLYVLDAGAQGAGTGGGIRKVSTTGTVTTIAGANATATAAGNVDGTGTAASFHEAYSMCIDTAGQNLYVADGGNSKIRKVVIATGRVTTFAGSGTSGHANGAAGSAQFSTPRGIAIDASDNLYVADGNYIRKVTPTGVVSDYAGTGSSGRANGATSTATFNGPYHVECDSNGFVFVADTGNNEIRVISPDGVVSLLAGSAAGTAGTADGTTSTATFTDARGLFLGVSGDLFVGQHGSTGSNPSTVRRIAYTAVSGFTITPSAGSNGSISPSGAQVVASGGSITFTVTANSHYHIDTVLKDGVSVGASSSVTFTNVTAPHSITASFALDTYTLDYTAGANGTLSGTTPQTVGWNLSGTTVTAVPDPGYSFVSWSDGVLTAARRDTNVQAGVSVTANFAKNVTVTALASDKVYDGTADAVVALSSADFVPGDDVQATYASASFDDRNVGVGKTVTASGIALTGLDAGKYHLLNTTASSSATITVASLTLTAVADEKVYDGTTSSSASPLIAGVATGDSVTGVTQVFADRNVGTGKTIDIDAYSVNDGNGGANYTVTTVSNTSGVITPAELIISAVTDTKTYDGTVSSSASPTVVGLQDSDTVSGVVQEFAGRDVGPQTIVLNWGAFAVNDGNDGNNYTVSGQDSSGSITVKNLSITAGTDTKVYDGTTSSVGTPTVVGLVDGDTVTGLSQAFEDKNVGTGKTIWLSGSYTVNDGNGGNNYSVFEYPNHTGVITAKGLSITAVADSKTYDRTTSSSAVPTVSGLATGDSVTDLVQVFDTKDVATGKTLTVDGYTVNDGNSGNNYTVSTFTNTAGVITAKALTISGASASGKEYDGGTAASVTGGSLTGVIAPDSVGIGTYTAAFASKNVGSRAVTVSAVTLTGPDAGNYVVSPMPTVANATITAKALTISGASAAGKQYDGTTAATVTGGSLSGVISPDVVAIGTYTAAFSSKTLGSHPVTVSAVTLSGADAGNYVVSPMPTVADATITVRSLTITGASASGKVYDGTDTASVSGGSLSGVISPDAVSIGTYTATFASKNVGSRAVTVSAVTLTGADAGNYVVSPMPTVANATITAKALTISGAGAADKQYDGTTAASVSGGSLTGVVSPDVVGIGTFTAAFADKNVGASKSVSVSAVTLSGADAGNYVVSPLPTVANAAITAKPLTITAASDSKTYDGTTSSVGVPVVTGLVLGDTVTGKVQTFDDKNVGTGKTLTVVGYTVNDGNSGNNYSVSTFTNTSGVISALSLTITANPQIKTEGTTFTFAGTEFTHSELVSGDSISGVTLASGGAAAGAVPGSYPIVASAATGTGLGNYDITYVDGTFTVVVLQQVGTGGLGSVAGVGPGGVLSIAPGTLPPGVSGVIFNGFSFTVMFQPGFTGSAIVPIVVTQNGVSTTVYAHVAVAPPTTRLIGVIRFAPNSPWLSATAKAKLRSIARWVRSHRVTKLTLAGLTEKHEHGSIIFRKWLSLRRANMARAYLLAQFKKMHIKVTIVAVGSGGAGKNLDSYRRVDVYANNLVAAPQ